ncbi:Ig-like domain-containing protein [Candidatus Palauibacter sp.]|uniref:Ig-like domain-containing protein n=1 Tax=Candidatus Palauibacter sp. TaxID=3101350 RepID=UPI003AF31138
MNGYRLPIFVAATLSATLWAYACGDATTEPPTPTPDPPRPTTVTVTPATHPLTALDATVQLTAEVRDQNGQVMAGAGVTWTSNATSIATVGGSGLVTAAGNGTATITATAGSVSGSATVTVSQEVTEVAISPSADTLVAGDTLRLAAEAFDENGHAVAGAAFTWSSSDTSVTVVDPTGLATGVDAGEAEVSATSSGVTGRVELTVVTPAPTTVAITPDTVVKMTALGDTARLVAEVRDQAGRVMEDEAVVWASGDTLVATVDAAGLVTAAGMGATSVTAMAGEASGRAAVTVMQSAGSVTVSPAADTVALGDTLRLVAEAFDENGHLVEGAEFTWSSSDVSVSTVDASGLVRGVAEGTATITATASDARGIAEITVENPDRAALVAVYQDHLTDPNWTRATITGSRTQPLDAVVRSGGGQRSARRRQLRLALRNETIRRARCSPELGEPCQPRTSL